MSFQVTNHTEWNTADISAFVRAGMKAKHLTVLAVTVTYGRGDACWGGVARSRLSIDLTLPGPKYVKEAKAKGAKPLNLQKLAQVFEYLLDMTVADRSDLIHWHIRPASWSDGLDIRWGREEMAPLSADMKADLMEMGREKAAAKIKAKAEKREAKVREKLADYEAKQKWFAKKIRELRVQVRYYDRKKTR